MKNSRIASSSIAGRSSIRDRIRGRISTTNLILIAAVAVAIGLWLGVRVFERSAYPVMQAAVMYPNPRALPDFSLTRSDAQPLTLADWKGHWTVAFFGYTHCPDVCPTTLAAFTRVWHGLGDTKAHWAFDFISVDPTRDKPEQLAQYVGLFDKDFIGATGNDAELAKLTGALGLVYSRAEAVDGNYAVDHSASAVIIDPQGRQAGLFRPPFDVAKISADLRSLVDSH